MKNFLKTAFIIIVVKHLLIYLTCTGKVKRTPGMMATDFYCSLSTSIVVSLATSDMYSVT